MKTDRIELVADDGSILMLEPIEQTRFSGRNYLLVEDENEDCYILKDISGDSSSEALYEMVLEEKEYDCLNDIFSEILADSDIALE
jgi:hypothetical protein